MHLDNSLFVILICTAFLSFMLTYLVRRIALEKKIIDIPNVRSSHVVPTPRGGGLAIIVTWALVLTALFIKQKIEEELFFALLSVFPLVIIGLLDDILTINAKIRMVIQIISVGFAFYFLNGVDNLNVGFYIIDNKVLLTSLFFVGALWFINLYNFLDGIDAYASSQAIFMSLAIFFFTSNSILLFLAATVLGFIFWNWPKAKIFMGDVGSTFLGYTLFILGVYYNSTGEFSFINWLIISSLFWFDATLTLYRRWKNKEQLTMAHKKHAYQRIVQYGFSHKKTVLLALMINIILLGINYFSIQYPKYVLLFLLIASAKLFVIVKLIDKKMAFK